MKPRAKPRPKVRITWEHVVDDEGVTVMIRGLATLSEANQSEHYMVKHKRKKGQQLVVQAAMREIKPTLARFATGPLKVRFVRFGGRHMDRDNLSGAFKHIQDCVFYWLKRDDGDKSIQFEYDEDLRPGIAVQISVDRL